MKHLNMIFLAVNELIRYNLFYFLEFQFIQFQFLL